jgi:hypothetical protein
MFGWFKRRKEGLMAKMVAYTHVGRIAFISGILEALKAQGIPENQLHGVAEAASAWALNGTLPEGSSLTVAQAQEHAMRVLRAHPAMQELAVQTARVEAWCIYAQGGVPSVEITPVLLIFGKSHPVSPDPKSYPAMVFQYISTLSVDAQANIRAWIKQAKQGSE